MRKSLFLFILMLQIWTLHAEGYYCKHIGIENGLSQSAVSTIVYDGRGALWIGTRFGLNEYRNGKLRTFTDDGSGRIQGNYIYLMHLDSQGNLWASTDKGLFIYEPSEDAFKLLSDEPVTCAIDAEDGIWFGTHFNLAFYSFKTKSFTGGDSEVYTDFQQLYVFEDKILSIEKRAGPSLHTAEGSETLPVPELEGSLILASALDGDILYLSILKYGLIGYSLSERRTVFSRRSGESDLPHELLLSLLIVDDELWMGFDGASIRTMNLQDHSIKRIEHDPAQTDGQIPISVTTLYQDPLGNIWLGSVRSGVVGLKQSPIKSFAITDKYPEAEDVIIYLLSSKDGNIYMGTDGSGVCRYNPKTGINLAEGQQGFKVTSIADFDENNLVIATYNRGLFLMDRVTSRLRPFILVDEATNQAECFNSNAPIIYNMNDGRILFLAVNSYIYDPHTRKFDAFTDMSDGNSTEIIAIGYGNNTFYAYSQAGLFSVDLTNRTVTRIFEPDLETGSVNTAVIHSGLIWFGTNYGLFTFDPRTSQVSKIDSGLFKRVSRLESNGTDNLWIAADNTLFLSRNGLMEMTGENRGVPANEILSSTCSSDGTVYLGGTAGLVEIGADCYFSVDENKTVELRDVSSESLRLPYNYSSLVITVNLAGADPFERILYRYQLTGASELTTETFEDSISLPALKPGNYRLNVSYLKSDGSWSAPQTVASLLVKQPWYASVPMVIFYILLIFGITVFSIDRLSKRRIKALEAELRSRDMEFTRKLESYLDEHIADPQLNVNQIASHMSMSRATLYYKMNSSFSKGVAELIEEKRMAKAEELLSTTSLSILDISEKVGYSTPRYFSTRFKQTHNGQTPLKFRQTHR